MTVANTIQFSFASGELDPKVHGRFNLKLNQSGLEHCENFIVEPQGPARFRTGTRYVNHTRLNQKARFVAFQFNDTQAYILEFTNLFMRVFKDEGQVLEDNKTITGATAANPVVITSTAHGYSNGDEVYISNVAGMTELNGKFYLVANQAANTFELTDIDGANINGLNFTAYDSGGTSGKVFEVATPYLEAELFEFDFDQNADVLTVTHNKHNIRNITRTDHAVWTVETFSRTADPFPSRVITGISQASQGVVTSVAHGFSNDEVVTIQEVVGMVELNSVSVIVSDKVADTFKIKDLTGTYIDTSGFTLYDSAGTVGDYPRAVGYYEGRRFFGATLSLPETWWGSRGPKSSGDGLPQYDNYQTGTAAETAVIFTMAPSFEGTVNAIRWLAGTSDFLGIGTFGGINKATGSGQDEPITPDSINVKPMSDVGSAEVSPIPRGSVIIFVQRGRLKIRSLEYNFEADSFIPVDRNFVADHIAESGFVQLSFQDGVPDVLWGVLNNGKFAGLTFKTSEDVSGWHRHILGGTDVKVLSVASMSLPNSFDQLWVVVERTINSVTRRYVEFFEDEPIIPRRFDFVTGDLNKAADKVTFDNAMFEAQKGYMHVDSALTFDGSLAGSDASVSVTPASVSGTGVTFTASGAIFDSGDVGKEIWKKAVDGVGEGRAVITAFTDTTHVDCTITKAFDNIDTMAAGGWYRTTATLSGLDHLEGELVTVISDGAEHPQRTITNGSITLDFQASKVHVGEGYIGRLVTLNLESGGVTGPAQTKARKIEKINVRFLNTLRARWGTDIYNLEEMTFRNTSSNTNRPEPLLTGIKKIIFPDSWENEKKVIVEQRHPLPCIVQFLDIFMETSDE